MLTGEKRPRWVYLLPSLHLAACLISMIGVVIPDLSSTAIIFMFIMIVDLPFSAVAYAFAWRYPTFSAIWVFTVGTLYWYWIGRGVEALVRRLREKPAVTSKSGRWFS